MGVDLIQNRVLIKERRGAESKPGALQWSEAGEERRDQLLRRPRETE